MKKLKEFAGTWFEIQHPNIPEGKYWNDTCREFTSEQWKEKVDEIASLGMKYLVLMNTSKPTEDSAESYYPTTIYPFAEQMGCVDPLDAVMDAADKHGMKMFISCGFYGPWTHTIENMTSKDVDNRAFQSMGELYNRYGHHSSFYGWYYPDETKICPYFRDDFIDYVCRYSHYADTLDEKKKKLIAPYGTNRVIVDDEYIRQLENLPVDIVAYQDEVGARKTKYTDTRQYYEQLNRAHRKAGRSELWCDLEAFEFEGDPLKSPLIPASISRIQQQLENVSDLVSEILIYQYQGMFNRPGTTAFCGHQDSYKLYEDYQQLRKNICK